MPTVCTQCKYVHDPCDNLHLDFFGFPRACSVGIVPSGLVAFLYVVTGALCDLDTSTETPILRLSSVRITQVLLLVLSVALLEHCRMNGLLLILRLPSALITRGPPPGDACHTSSTGYLDLGVSQLQLAGNAGKRQPLWVVGGFVCPPLYLSPMMECTSQPTVCLQRVNEVSDIKPPEMLSKLHCAQITESELPDFLTMGELGACKKARPGHS